MHAASSDNNAKERHERLIVDFILNLISPLPHRVSSSSGYFVHDAADIILTGHARQSWEFLIHHVLVRPYAFLFSILLIYFLICLAELLFRILFTNSASRSVVSAPSLHHVVSFSFRFYFQTIHLPSIIPLK